MHLGSLSANPLSNWSPVISREEQLELINTKRVDQRLLKPDFGGQDIPVKAKVRRWLQTPRSMVLRGLEVAFMGGESRRYWMPEWNKTANVRDHVISCVTVQNPEEHHYPSYTRLTSSGILTEADVVWIKERRRYELCDVLVDVRSGIPWTPDRWILGGIQPGHFDDRTWHNWGRFRRRAPETHKRGIVQASPPWFFHWLIEQVPASIRESHARLGWPMFVSHDAPAWVHTGLSDLGLNPHPTNAPVVHFEEYVVETRGSWEPLPKDLHVLRDALIRSTVTNEQSKYLLVSRKGHRRYTAKDAEIESALVSRGFSLFHPEEHSLPEVRCAFENAKCVVAATGAGLSHAVWMQEGSTLIAYVDSDYGFPFLWNRLLAPGVSSFMVETFDTTAHDAVARIVACL